MTQSLKQALLAAAAVSLATPAFAADPSVLVVDFQKVFSDAAAARSGTSQLQAKYNALLQQKRTAFQTAAQAYNAQVESAKATLKPNTPIPPATQQSLQAAGQRAQQAQQDMQDTQEDVNEAAGYVRQQIIQRATPIAEQIRAERKASVVLAKESVLANDPSTDVTAVVIQRLDAAFTTPSITPPQQAAAPAAATTAPATRPAGRPATQGR